MTEYKIILDGPFNFGVEITATGSFRSVRGFPTGAAATAWIVEQQARDAAATDRQC